jgi:hypothetical protein
LTTNSFSGQEVKANITYVLKNWVSLEKDYCVFSFKVSQNNNGSCK